MKKEYCGIFGISGHPEAARMTYFGLYAQQHRGQESAGIISWDGKAMHEHKGMGLVPDIFKEEHLGGQLGGQLGGTSGGTLPGSVAIGHVRYSTTGSSALCNAQPFRVCYGDLSLAVAHNGNLVNALETRRKLEAAGSIFQTGIDSEVFLHLIVRNLEGRTPEEAVIESCKAVKGAYSLVVLIDGKLIALRDPHGFRPLALGRVGASYVVASETCAFDLVEAEYLRTLEPGEMLAIDGRGLKSFNLGQAAPARQCIFELVYFARPDSYIFNENVYSCRKEMGRQLALQAPVDADFVMPLPDSGIYCAVGFAQALNLPYEHALIRNHYVGRTFIQPSQDMRDFSVRVKINPVREMIKGKRIVIVDDSIVRGTTMRTRVKKLRELGAREVHCRISCPPVKSPCFYGVDFAIKGELLAANHSVEEIRQLLGLDSLAFLSIEGLERSVSRPTDYCFACYNCDYPVPIPEEAGKFCLENR